MHIDISSVHFTNFSWDFKLRIENKVTQYIQHSKINKYISMRSYEITKFCYVEC